MAVISLSGYIGSGKNQFCTILQQILREKQQYWQQKAHAAKLKQICALILNIPVEKFEDAAFKKTDLGPEWDRSLKDANEFLMMKIGDHPAIGYNDETRRRALELGFRFTRTVREFMQELGTDAVRYHLHPDTWLNALWVDYYTQPVQTHWAGHRIIDDWAAEQMLPNWILTDTRFPNEIQAAKKRSAIMVRIDRGPRTSDHASETSIDLYKDWDYRVDNTGTLEQLHEKAKEFINHFNL
jgi:hypothetical protein